MNKAVQKYLANYAEDTALLGANLSQSFDNVVVIPAYAEGRSLDRAIASVPCVAGESALAVVLINERLDSSAQAREMNATSVKRLLQFYANQQQLAANATLCATPFGAMALVQVNLPSDQGVGLARKYGADFAFGAWAAGNIASSWMHCTDADVLLPGDYFAAEKRSAPAKLHRFRHRVDDEVPLQHMQIYDTWLRLHVLGLYWAGSPYAFHTIGSTIAVDMLSYAAVRGFPRRQAAEDFYFLNKLAKLGRVIDAASEPIQITARVSQRVPFGTGRAMELAQNEGVGALPAFYHPSVYRYLKVLLNALQQSALSGQFNAAEVNNELANQGLKCEPFMAALQLMDFEVAITKRLNSSKAAEQRLSAMHGWFDAFRTLKFIHHLRDSAIPGVGIESALHDGEFLLRQSGSQLQDDIAVIRQLVAQGKCVL